MEALAAAVAAASEKEENGRTMASDNGNCDDNGARNEDILSQEGPSPASRTPGDQDTVMDVGVRMSLPDDILPLLKEHNLEAIVVNEGWILIRRKSYIDLFIEDQPYNSVEVLLHSVTTVRSFLLAHSRIVTRG